MKPYLEKLLKHLAKEQLIGVVSNGVYALAEICDRRNPLADCVPEKTAMMVGTYLESAEKNCRCCSQDRLNLTNRIKIAAVMIQGNKLTVEQKEALLKLREKEED